MSEMHNPLNLGETLREIPTLGLTVAEAVLQLGVTRLALPRILNRRAAIAQDAALRLVAWRSGRAEVWHAKQITYDIWHARRNLQPKIARMRKVQRIKEESSLNEDTARSCARSI